MKTTVSSKGQIVIPSAVRKRLQLGVGSALNVTMVPPNKIVCEVIEPERVHYKIKRDKKTGYPVAVSPHAPKVTSEQVAAALEEFP